MKTTVQSTGEAMPKIKELSFVASRDGKQLPKYTNDQLPRCFWNVQPTGDYRVDSALGRKLALEYLAFEAADRGGPGHLQMIVNDMPRPVGAIEVSFLTLVSYAAAAGRHEAQRVSSYWSRGAAEEEANV